MSLVVNVVRRWSLLLGLLGPCACGGRHQADGSDAAEAASVGGSAAGEPGVGGRGTASAAGGGAAGAAGATVNGGAGTADTPPSDPSHFISVWNTAAGYPRFSDDDQISLPLVEHGTYDFIVFWGDGTTDVITSWDAPATTHTYPAVGTYTVVIVGVISGWRFAHAKFDIVEWSVDPRWPSGDAGKLEAVVQWGSLSLGDTFAQFHGAANLVITATDAPDLTQTTSLSDAFSDCSHLESIPNLDAWDVSGVTDLSYMFRKSAFNQDLSGWNLSSATDMSYMFQGSAYDRDLSGLDVSNVTNMTGMFAGTTAFNQDLSAWDVSSVTDMSRMFRESVYDQDLSAWDVSSVMTMTEMFLWSAYGRDLSDWDVSSVADMSFMFMGSAYDQDLSAWDVSSVTTMNGMFQDVTLSTANYDALLIAWAQRDVQDGVSFDGGSSTYSAAAADARQSLIADHGWDITDGGCSGPGCSNGG